MIVDSGELTVDSYLLLKLIAHLPHAEVSQYEFWLFGDFGLAIAKLILQFFVYSDLAPLSTSLQKPGFLTKNLGFQAELFARN